MFMWTMSLDRSLMIEHLKKKLWNCFIVGACIMCLMEQKAVNHFLIRFLFVGLVWGF